jgi:NAD+ kinase
MRLAIYGRVIRPDTAPYIHKLFGLLQDHGHELLICDAYLPLLKDYLSELPPHRVLEERSGIRDQADCLISMGGDGTILDAATLVRDSGVPILGINIGRLGFLSTIGKESMELAVQALEKGTYTPDSRTLLHLDTQPESLFGDVSFALNEFAVLKKDSSSMITIHAYINGEFMSSYWADGVIVATPTGSTGYSLSCGGPIVFPTSNSLVITPVAPHNLNVRPMVVPDDAVISFEVEGRGHDYLLTLDSRQCTARPGTQLAVRKEAFQIKLIRLDDMNFLSTLRSKLNLGADTRNRA